MAKSYKIKKKCEFGVEDVWRAAPGIEPGTCRNQRNQGSQPKAAIIPLDQAAGSTYWQVPPIVGLYSCAMWGVSVPSCDDAFFLRIFEDQTDGFAPETLAFDPFF